MLPIDGGSPEALARSVNAQDPNKALGSSIDSARSGPVVLNERSYVLAIEDDAVLHDG